MKKVIKSFRKMNTLLYFIEICLQPTKLKVYSTSGKKNAGTGICVEFSTVIIENTYAEV
jgi:hypothetical protein